MAIFTTLEHRGMTWLDYVIHNQKDMFKYFERRKFKKDVEQLENSIVFKLGDLFPELVENQARWTLYQAMVLGTKEKYIQLLHQSVDSNPSGSNKLYKVKGFEILNKRTNVMTPFSISVYNNLIHHIFLPFDNSINKEFDLTAINLNNTEYEEIDLENPDVEALSQILVGLESGQLALFEVENTFKIELENNIYYTIIDLGEGDYIAVDKKGTVYRLVHDHTEPVKQIAESISDFLLEYKGDKKDLSRYIVE